MQRAYLGISYDNASDMSAEQKKARNIPASAFGIFVQEATTDGGAAAAGIRKGDIIKSINGVNVISGAEMQEQVSRYKPGDKVTVIYERNQKDAATVVTLKNKAGNYEVVKAEMAIDLLGAELLTLDATKAKDFGVKGGVVVKKINEGVLNEQTRMKGGFIILKVNEKAISSLDELKKEMADKKSVTISGFYPGYEGLYEYPVTLDKSAN